MPHYNIIAKPLTQLLTKEGFHWDERTQAAFELLKQAMVKTPTLVLPNFAHPFVIEMDSCDTGVTEVLIQDGHPLHT